MILLSFVLAFCSFSYEILLAFVVAKITGQDIISQTICIGSFIVGLGLGSFWIERNPQSNKLGFLLKVEVLLSLVGGLGLFFVFGWDALLKSLMGTPPFLLFFIPVQIYILLIGFLSGLELPSLLDEKKNENKVLGWHYFGTLMSAVLIFAWFIPKIDVFYTALLIALLNVGVALGLYLRSSGSKKSLAGVGIVSVTLVALIAVSDSFYKQYLKVFYFQPQIESFDELENSMKVLKARPEVRRYRSTYQYIDFIDENKDGKTSLLMFLDHRYQFSSSHEAVYHEHMVHVPASLSDSQMKNVLVLGGGDGLIARELLKYEQIEKVTLVELDQEILNFATTDVRLTSLNKDSLKNPRVEIIVGDAISFIRSNNKIYDAIFLDFPYPNNYDLSKLYSLEFYKAIRKRMTESAFLILDYPVDKLAVTSSHRNEVILSTLEYAGFTNNIIFGEEDTFVMSALQDKAFVTDKNFEFLSERSRKELLFREDIVRNTNLSSKKINSIFKPQKLQLRWASW